MFEERSNICLISLQVKNDYLIHGVYMVDIFNVFVSPCYCSLHVYNMYIKEKLKNAINKIFLKMSATLLHKYY